MALEVTIRKQLDSFLLDVKFCAEDEVFAVLGESGCGKSMTLKCIAGIETPDKGRIVLNGRVLFDSEEKINLPPGKRRVGYLFQDYALFPNMTVEENIGISIPKKERKEKTKQYLRQFFLEGLEHSYPDHLSGGQKQRAAFARMMASEPEILLLDEPFSAVDSYLAWQMEKQLKEMLDRFKKTALFVSHDREEVYRFSHRMGIIHQGKMQEIGTKQEIFSHPRTCAAALLTGCKNISEIRRRKDGSIFCTDWGCEIHLPKERQNRKAETDQAQASPEVLGIHAKDISLLRQIGSSQTDIGNQAVQIPCTVSYTMESTEQRIYVLKTKNASGELRAEIPKLAEIFLKRGEEVTAYFPVEKCMLLIR